MKKSLKYIIATATGLAGALIIAFTRNVTGQETVKNIFGILSDAFFASGVCLVGVGLIVRASNGGAFDMLTYGFTVLLSALKGRISERRYRDFYEYSQAKMKKSVEFRFLLAVGFALVAVAIIFIIAYNSV